MSIDDRIRSAIDATAATVSEVRPFTLPPEGLPTGPRRRPSRRPRGHWSGWLIPLAAAVAVIVVAAVLVAVRDLPGLGHASSPPANSRGGVTGLPRYGVVLTDTLAKLPPKWGSGDVTVSDLSVIDTRAGKRVALVKHPAGFGFTAVSGAADDQTFVLSAVSIGLLPQPGNKGEMANVWVFYLLRLAPDSSQPPTLTRLSIPVQPHDADISGFALSPDGRTLAVTEWCTEPGGCYPGSPGTLRLYSVATGKALRTWTWGAPPYPVPTYGTPSGWDQNSAGLTWLAGGRTLAFTYYAHGQTPTVRTLDISRSGGDLMAASRRVFTLPSSGPNACQEAMLTPDGQTVVCGTQSPPESACKTRTLEIDAYSAATGKRERVLYRYTARCTADGVGTLGWVGAGNAVVAMVDAGILQSSLYPVSPGVPPISSKVVVGLVNQGKLVPIVPATLPFGQGPGTIAF